MSHPMFDRLGRRLDALQKQIDKERGAGDAPTKPVGPIRKEAPKGILSSGSAKPAGDPDPDYPTPAAVTRPRPVAAPGSERWYVLVRPEGPAMTGCDGPIWEVAKGRLMALCSCLAPAPNREVGWIHWLRDRKCWLVPVSQRSAPALLPGFAGEVVSDRDADARGLFLVMTREQMF